MATKITWADYAIDELLDRSGFDAWWSEIPSDIQQEIKDGINRVIREAEGSCLTR